MTTRLTPYPKFRALDSNGDPLASGKLYSYAAGTSTPLDTYDDQTGGNANANPVILDSNGEADVWLTESSGYKFILKDSSDVQQWEVDNIYVDPTGPNLNDFVIVDNTANAWRVRESTNNYIHVDTTDSSEDLNLGNTTTNPAFNFLGTGKVIVNSDCELYVTSNDVYLSNSYDSGGNLYLKTTSGSIFVSPAGNDVIEIDTASVDIGNYDFTVNTDKFVVDSATGNVDIGGDLTVTSDITLGDKLTIDTDLEINVTSNDVLMKNITTGGDITIETTSGDIIFEPNGSEVAKFSGSGTLDMTGEFLIKRTSQNSEPTITQGELRIWHDADDNKVYLMYRDATEGAVKIELT